MVPDSVATPHSQLAQGELRGPFQVAAAQLTLDMALCSNGG
jgi:hypothetical protein